MKRSALLIYRIQQLLVVDIVVANFKMRAVTADVETCFMRAASGHGLADLEKRFPHTQVTPRVFRGNGVHFLSPGCEKTRWRK